MLDAFKSLPGWLKLWIVFPLGFLNGWLLLRLFDYLQPFLNILIAAAILAFLLDLPAIFLQQRGIPKGVAIAAVVSTAMLLLIGLGSFVVPIIIDQLRALISNLPQLLESGQLQLQRFRAFAIAQNLPINITDLLNQQLAQLGTLFQVASNQVLNVVSETISSAVNVLFFIVLTIFIILGGESAWEGIFSWFPAPWNETLRTSIQSTFRRYFGTQVLLASILGVAQTLGLVFWGVPYAVLFGVTMGVATLIPYAGAVVTLLVSLIVALQDFGQGVRVLITAIAIGQINDIFLSPRLMGETIGLNPIWIIASLFLGGKVGGLLGLLVAVPVASVIKSTFDRLRSTSQPTDSPSSVAAVPPSPLPSEPT
ncbi:MAG TPA: AI-2E family transporter [Synechococcales cyanobacterium M55_K2018_004]|nr:AI-2E family transporter [Synechococcales cyanobacterium M55_K2018_004]